MTYKEISRIAAQKNSFVKSILSPLLMALDDEIIECEYNVTIHDNISTGADLTEEYVHVAWRHGGEKNISVWGDSNKAIVTDILKAI